MLVVCNLTGGGAAFFREAFLAVMQENFVWLKYDTAENTYQFIYAYDGKQGPAVAIPLGRMDQALFNELLAHFCIKEIFLNHILDLPQQIIDLVKNAPVPYSVFVHDYIYVCPQIRLYRQTEQSVCSGKASDEECARCCGSGILEVRSQRSARRSLLSGAAAVIVPSAFVERRLSALWKAALPIVVKPHYLPWMDGQERRQPQVGGNILTLTFIGALTKLKGCQMIKEILHFIRAEKLPLRIAVAGVIEGYGQPYHSSDGRFIVSGEYERSQLSAVLAALDTTIVGVLSIWEETYSYTTSEALLAGYPVLAFRLGAQAQRLEKYDCGWTMENLFAIYDFLRYIVTPHGRREIQVKAAHTKRFVNGAD